MSTDARAAGGFAARRKRPKRSLWHRTVWPLIKLVSILTLAVIVVGAVCVKSVRPVSLLIGEYRATRELSSRLASVKKENAGLDRKIKYLQTRQGAEAAARRLGYVLPGEITLVLPPE